MLNTQLSTFESSLFVTLNSPIVSYLISVVRSLQLVEVRRIVEEKEKR